LAQKSEPNFTKIGNKFTAKPWSEKPQNRQSSSRNIENNLKIKQKENV